MTNSRMEEMPATKPSFEYRIPKPEIGNEFHKTKKGNREVP